VAEKSHPLSFPDSSERTDGTPLSEALSTLVELSQRLRRDAKFIASVTVVVIFSSIIIVLRPLLKFSLTFVAASISGLVILAIIVLLLAVDFESTRKKGDALFKEISDELQWNLRFSDPDSPPPPKRVQLNMRLALRSFAGASELPLIPGQYGPLTYVVINMISVLLATFVPLAFKHMWT